MKNERIYSAAEMLVLNNTDQILGSKAAELRKNFYHYTKLDSAQKILAGDLNGNRFIFVRNIASMNDRKEADLHKENGEKIYAFCTCCAKHEKIPLWYLYSGICGNGARIGFSPGRMLKFLNSIGTIYPINGNEVDYTNPLREGRDFTLFCGWVFYLMDGNNRALYRGRSYAVEMQDTDSLKKNYFIKDYPWEYEQEFRIVIKNETDAVYEKVAIPLPAELIPELEIMSAPECDFSEEEKRKLVDFGICPERIKNSKLQIHMDLLKNNRADIVSQVDKWCDADQCTKVCSYIRAQEKCNQLKGGKEDDKKTE